MPARDTVTDTTGVSDGTAFSTGNRVRITSIKVPRGNELFARFSAAAFHMFTEKHVTGSKAPGPVGVSPFFARPASIEGR